MGPILGHRAPMPSILDMHALSQADTHALPAIRSEGTNPERRKPPTEPTLANHLDQASGK